MSRPLRIEYPGAFYHITSRGNACQDIFFEKDDFKLFKSIFKSVMDRYHWKCYAYCLMNNHYHLLIETIDGQLSLGMRHLNGVYTQKFNRRYQRVGHIFQGRFKSVLVDKESYLMELCRYIVLNPFRAKMESKVGQWPWSSYKEMIGVDSGISLVDKFWVLEQFAIDEGNASQAYKSFIADGVKKMSPWKGLKGGILGGDEFIEIVKKHSNGLSGKIEISKKDRFLGRKKLEDIVVLAEGKKLRSQQVYEAHHDCGYTLAEIGRHMKLHYSTVSRVYKGFVRDK